MGEALGAAAPVDHLGLVDLESRVGGGDQARRRTDCAVDIDHPAAGATDQVVVVVAGAAFVPCRRPGRVDAPNQTLFGENAEGVVHRLAGNGADLLPDGRDDVVRGAVRSTRHCRQNGKALSSDLNTVSSEENGRIVVHDVSIAPRLDCVKYWIGAGVCSRTTPSPIQQTRRRGELDQPAEVDG